MQENDFEKQVRQTLDKLQFDPSAPVWQKVEAQIRRKKKRRRVVFLLLPLLLTGGGLIWYFSGLQGSTTLQNVTAVQQHKTELKESIANADTLVSNSKQNVLQKENEEKINASIINRSTFKTNSENSQPVQKENETFLKVRPKQSKQIEATPIDNLHSKKEIESSVQETRDGIMQHEIAQKENALAIEKLAEQKNVSKPFYDTGALHLATPAPLVPMKEVNGEKVNAFDSSINVLAIAPTVNKNDSTEPKAAMATPVTATKQNKIKTWEWTASGRLGISGVRNQVMDVFTVESAADFYASPAMGNTSSPAFSSSSSINNGSAFSLSAGVRKKMFKNAFISTGLQYSQYRSQSTVGARKNVDTTVFYNGRANALESYFDQSGSQSVYTTRFHYIEIPIAFEYRLFKKVPLQMQHGLSAGYLIATNALYYDRAARVFHQNDEWLRKIGFNIFTALDYRFWQAGKFSLFAGPQVQWGLTPLQRKREDKKHHQFFAGLQTRITF